MKNRIKMVAIAGILSLLVAAGVILVPPEPASAALHSCDIICDILAAKYGWTAEMVANCHLNCSLGNGPCPLEPEDCDDPDLPDP